VFGAGSLYWPHEIENNVSEQEVHERIKGLRDQGKVHTN